MTQESTRATTAPDFCQFCDQRIAKCNCFVQPSPSTGGDPAHLFADLTKFLPADFMWGDELHAVTLAEILSAYESQRALAVAGGEPATDSAGLPEFDEGKLMDLVRDFAAVCYGQKRTTEDVGGKLVEYVKSLAAREPAPVACKWPTCQSEAYQDELAKEIHRQLYSGEPAPVARELPEHKTRFANSECFARELDADAERRATGDAAEMIQRLNAERERQTKNRVDGCSRLLIDAAWMIEHLATRATAESAPASAAPANAVIEAARKLVKAKGRYHTEQNYKALMAEVAEYDALAAALAKMDDSPVGAKEQDKDISTANPTTKE